MTASHKHRFMLKSVLPTLLSAVLLSAGALAGEYPATFESLDKDGDGYISSREAAARKDLSKNWTAIDTDKDDKLTITEFSAFEGKESFVPPEESEEPGIGAAPY